MDVQKDLCLPVAELLWAIHGSADTGPRLIFPFKRNDSDRVSEQESRVLMCQVLEKSDLYYSVETPTRERYQHLGQSDRSASIDLTVYASRTAADRLINVELKSGTPAVVEIHRDLEKLVREGIGGLWFCTIERANRSTIATVIAHIREALELVNEHADVAEHSITLALCILSDRVLLTANLQLSPNTADDFLLLDTPELEGWTWAGVGADDFAVKLRPAERRIPRPVGVGKNVDRSVQETLLIYCPQLAADTFLHYSQVGNSYRLRAFTGVNAGKTWQQTDAPTATEFMRAYPPSRTIDVRAERRPVTDAQGWSNLIAVHNRAIGLWTAGIL